MKHLMGSLLRAKSCFQWRTQGRTDGTCWREHGREGWEGGIYALRNFPAFKMFVLVAINCFETIKLNNIYEIFKTTPMILATLKDLFLECGRSTWQQIFTSSRC